ncbi:hypothetical protein Tco_0153159 [Tanacetum coccineum]
MGHGTWYYSLGVSSIVDAFVRSEFGISSWRGSRVDGRSYLQSGAIDGSEANGIIRDPKKARGVERLQLQGEGWFECGFMELLKPGGVRVAREDDRGVTEGREDVREVFQQRGSRAKREAILDVEGINWVMSDLALPEGAADFIRPWCIQDMGVGSFAPCIVILPKWQFRIWKHAWKREKVIACTSRQLKVLMKDCMANVFLFDELRDRVVNDVVTRLKVSDEFLNDGQHSMIALVKVHWDSKRGPEFTWERKDQMRSKCPQLLVKPLVIDLSQLFVDSDILPRVVKSPGRGFSEGQILDEIWTYWIKEFLKGICKRVMTLGELGEIIREVFVKLLLDSFGKLSIRIERERLNVD